MRPISPRDQTVRRCVARRRIHRGRDLQGGVICLRCNAKAVNLAGGELRCGEIGAVIVSAEISEAVKCRWFFQTWMMSLQRSPVAVFHERPFGNTCDQQIGPLVYTQLLSWGVDGRGAPGVRTSKPQPEWPVQRCKVWLTPTTRMPCSNAAKMRNPLKLPGVPQTNETISAASGPKFTILWGNMEEILLLNKFFSDCRYVIFGNFFAFCIFSEPRAARFRPAF